MVIIQTILNFFVQFISNPTILIALIALVGLLIRKAPAADCLKGTIKTIVGFTLISSGAGIVQTSIGPLNSCLLYTSAKAASHHPRRNQSLYFRDWRTAAARNHSYASCHSECNS